MPKSGRCQDLSIGRTNRENENEDYQMYNVKKDMKQKGNVYARIKAEHKNFKPEHNFKKQNTI